MSYNACFEEANLQSEPCNQIIQRLSFQNLAVYLHNLYPKTQYERLYSNPVKNYFTPGMWQQPLEVLTPAYDVMYIP